MNIFKTIAITIIIVLIQYDSLCYPVNCSLDLNWIQSEIKTKVVHHYEVAYQTLTNGIIKPILNYGNTYEEVIEIDSSTGTNTEVYQTDGSTHNADLNSGTSEPMSSVTAEYGSTEQTSIAVTSASPENTSHYEQPRHLKLLGRPRNSINSLVRQINSSAFEIEKNLRTATNECTRLNTILQREISLLILNSSYKESYIIKLDVDLKRIQLEINNEERQIPLLEQLVQQRETSLANAERQLRDAEDRVEDARHCINKRMIADWWESNVEKPISQAKQHFESVVWPTVEDFARDHVVKPVCNIVNMQGIEDAKSSQSLAVTMLQQVRNDLSNKQAELRQKRRQIDTLRQRKNLAIQEQQTLRNQLSSSRNRQTALSRIKQTFSKILSHLGIVLGNSEDLVLIVKRLIDFELVIEPLHALAREMVKNGVMDSFGYEISEETVNQVESIIDRLKTTLSKLPLVLNGKDGVD